MWSTLNALVLEEIFDLLPDLTDLCRCGRVCRWWSHVQFSSQRVWRRKLLRKYGIRTSRRIPLPPGSQSSWRTEMKRLTTEVPLAEFRTLRDHDHDVLHADVDQEGKLLATCGRDAQLFVYRINGSLLTVLDLKKGHCLTFN